jgi:hypothetical protein
MPLQNRVTPFGEIEATPERGLFMGNRGSIHGPDGKLSGRRWGRKSWVTCRLDWKGINRIQRNGRLMAPGLYTELFFLDEVTALAAGHRPCNDCRREDLAMFKAAWVEPVATVEPIDEALHRERCDARGRKLKWVAEVGDLPEGTIVELPAEPGTPWLVHAQSLKQWSHGGYLTKRASTGIGHAHVLTPQSTVGVLRNDYRPVIHPSAYLLDDAPGQQMDCPLN